MPERNPERPPRGSVLTPMQIETPLEEFRRHFAKKQRSFEGTADGRASEIHRRAFELAESLIRRHSGGE
jgi:hypothetical protein